jgi:hypothetical protein
MPLDEQGRPEPFHMSSFESGNWPSKGYRFRSKVSRTRFLNDLLDIMRHRVKLRVFTVIWLHHYHALFSGDKTFKLPWMMCALGCASRIARWGERNASDRIPFTFERGGEGWGAAHDNICQLEKQGRLGKTKIGNWDYDDKHVAGLQAADLWAWELRNHFQAQLPGKPSYELRASLKKLVQGIPDGLGFIVGGSELETLMEDLRAGTSTIQPVPFASNGLAKLIPEALFPAS